MFVLLGGSRGIHAAWTPGYCQGLCKVLKERKPWVRTLELETQNMRSQSFFRIVFSQ